MGLSFTYDRRVEFRDTDAAGILHFASYFAYMEEAEHALLRELGTSVMQQAEGHVIGWPRVSATCDFRGSAKFEEVLTIRVTVDHVGTKSLTYVFDFQRGDESIARGKMTSVCCQIVHDHAPVSIPIPTDLKSKLTAANT